MEGLGFGGKAHEGDVSACYFEHTHPIDYELGTPGILWDTVGIGTQGVEKCAREES